jgi:hypothetical protein
VAVRYTKGKYKGREATVDIVMNYNNIIPEKKNNVKINT